MRRCLELAERGRGRVGSGAMVGAALVRDAKIIAEGWHEGFGKPHAEHMLLQNFRGSIEPTDILYINLEPCLAHDTKKTSGCTEQILKRGIRRVAIGMTDPDFRVAGSSILALKRAECELKVGVLRAQCEYFNRGYINLRTKHRPWITLKKAQTRAGAISHEDGSPMRITSPEQDAWSHTFLRAKHDAILVGIGTVLKDNPLLTPRLNKKNDQNLPLPYRLILDSRLQIPSNSSVVSDEYRHRTIIVADEKFYDMNTKEQLEQKDVRVIAVSTQDGCFDWKKLWEVLITPTEGFCGIASILVEGGRRTWTAFRDAKMIDAEVLLIEE